MKQELLPSGGIFDVPGKQEHLKTFEKKLLAEDLWDDPSKAQEILKEKSGIENSIKPFFLI